MEQIRRLITAVVLVLVMPLSLWASDTPATQRPTSNQEKLQKLLQTKSLQKQISQGSTRYRIGGNSGGGGGDEDGLDFHRTAVLAVSNTRKASPEANDLLNALDIDGVLSSMTVIVVDEPLDVEAQGVTQNSVAVNYPDSLTVIVNRPRWRAIKSQNMRESIALHEVLSLMRKEATGIYRDAAIFADSEYARETMSMSLKYSPSTRSADVSPSAAFEVMQQNYNESNEILSIDDLTEFSKRYNYSCEWVVKDLERGDLTLLSGYLVFKNYEPKTNAVLGSMDPKKTPRAQFVFNTVEPSVVYRRERTMYVRKQNGTLTFKYDEKLTSNVQPKSVTAFGHCSPN